jgi:hypothetical protein
VAGAAAARAVSSRRAARHQLRIYDLPDIGDHLIHFTGRTGGRMGDPVDIPSSRRIVQLAQGS